MIKGGHPCPCYSIANHAAVIGLYVSDWIFGHAKWNLANVVFEFRPFQIQRCVSSALKESLEFLSYGTSIVYVLDLIGEDAIYVLLCTVWDIQILLRKIL